MITSLIVLLVAVGARLLAATFNIADGDVAGLIAAINTANSNGQPDVINLAGNGIYTLTAADNNIDGQNGLPSLANDATGADLTINGNGATIARSSANGTPDFRILHLQVGTDVTINQLIISGGSAFPITNPPPSGTPSEGGGIYTHGTLALTNCTLSGNAAVGRGAGSQGNGGGVYITEGTVTITNCTFNGNTANGVSGGSGTSGGGSGGSGNGGGIFSRGVLTINGSTFSTNSAIGGNGGNGTGSGSRGGNGAGGFGGAIRTTNASATLINCTLGGNSATGGSGGTGVLSNGSGGFGGGGVINGVGAAMTNCTLSNNSAFGGSATGTFAGDAGGGAIELGSASSALLHNTIVAGNHVTAGSGSPAGATSGPDVDGAITSQGYNLVGDTSGSSGWMVNDLVNVAPQLGPLQNNGGPTYTMRPQANSPAIDKGGSGGPSADQRGFLRPQDLDDVTYPDATGGDASDIGAVEIGGPQTGTSLVVTTLSDYDKGGGASACLGDDCTLREAINAANSLAGNNAITFAPNVVGTITLSPPSLPAITSDINFQGPGARILAISGNSAMRMFSFAAGTSSISGLTIRDGFVSGSAAAVVSGAGILNQSNLTLTDCILYNNHVRGGQGTLSVVNGGTGNGGAFYNSSVLTLNRCTVRANSAYGGSGANFSGSNPGGNGGNGNGGAMYNETSGTLTLNNCTITGNLAVGGDGGNGSFFAAAGNGGNGHASIFNRGAISVTASTVSGNSASPGLGGTGGGGNDGAPGIATGGLVNSGGMATVGDTVAAGNGSLDGGRDVDGGFNSNGYNLIGSGDHSTGFSNGVNHDQVGTDNNPLTANLGMLQNNGGPTDTMALLSSSPAINNGNPNAPSRDQRQYLRNGVPDIGAFEFSGALAPVTAVSRRTHGSGTFDINLPLSGTVGIESRNGTTEQVIMNFATPISVANATATPDANKPGATGSVGSFSVSGSQLTVNLTAASNAQRLTINLTNISDGVNTNAAFALPMGILIGDTTGDGSVNSADISQTKSKSGQTVGLGNFRADVTVDGSLNSADISLVKSKSGTALP